LGAGTYRLKNSDDITVFEQTIVNSFTSLIVSNADLTEGAYTLWYNDTQLVGAVSATGGMPGGSRPDFPMGERPEGMMPPEGGKGEAGEQPDGFDPSGMKPDRPEMTPPDGFNGEGIAPPDGGAARPEFGDRGQGGRGPNGGFGGAMPGVPGELSEIFAIKPGANYFNSIGIAA
jgi:hypothetical protein